MLADCSLHRAGRFMERHQSPTQKKEQTERDVRLWGIGGEVDALDGDDVLAVVLVAELERGLAGDLLYIVDDDRLVPLDEDAGANRRETGGEEDDDGRSEPHREQGCRFVFGGGLCRTEEPEVSEVEVVKVLGVKSSMSEVRSLA